MTASRGNFPDQTKPAVENICAIIVTYFPDAHFAERLARIRAQVGRTIIVDNTGATGSITAAVAGDSDIIRNDSNLGIGEALNQGMACAAVLGYKWAISFDQDSWVDPDLVSTLISIYEQQPAPERVGIIGCNFEEENVRVPSVPFTAGGPMFRDMTAVITSGSLLSLMTHKRVGRFRSDFFIDFVDHEYCLRLLKLGYKVLSSTKPLMLHALGEGTVLTSIGDDRKLAIVLTNRSPLRRYYMTRNGLLVARQYFSVAPAWVLRSVSSLLLLATLKIPWEKKARLKKFRATICGLLDALRAKTGKADRDWLYSQES
jgi:rhamnosyltransferase